MRCVDLETLKHDPTAYVRLAADGETILVTDRGIVVAELIPPRERRSEPGDDAGLARLVREGVVDPPLLGRHAALPRRPTAPLATLLHEIRDDR